LKKTNIKIWTISSIIYQATVDGFSAAVFHAKCNNVKNLLVIIKTVSNFVFGAFTTVKFGKNEGYVESDRDNSFLFTLINPYHKKPVMLPIKNKKYTLYNDVNFGPTYGGYATGNGFSNADLHIVDNSNTNVGSCSNLWGKSYSNYADPTCYGSKIFAGTDEFGLIAEIFAIAV
jgi:hypothetical protein